MTTFFGQSLLTKKKQCVGAPGRKMHPKTPKQMDPNWKKPDFAHNLNENKAELHPMGNPSRNRANPLKTIEHPPCASVGCDTLLCAFETVRIAKVRPYQPCRARAAS